MSRNRVCGGLDLKRSTRLTSYRRFTLLLLVAAALPVFAAKSDLRRYSSRRSRKHVRASRIPRPVREKSFRPKRLKGPNGARDDSTFQSFYLPLILSTIAGASTCIGATLVFCFSPQVISKFLPFSLSLAGSVMITVSVISVGPECVKDLSWEDIGENIVKILLRIYGNSNQDGAASTTIGTVLPLSESFTLLLQRFVWFVAGCLGYWCLSKLVFPEDPETLIQQDHLQTDLSHGNDDDQEHETVLNSHQGPVGAGDEAELQQVQHPSGHCDLISSDSGIDDRRQNSPEEAQLGDTLSALSEKPNKHAPRMRRFLSSTASDGRAVPGSPEFIAVAENDNYDKGITEVDGKYRRQKSLPTRIVRWKWLTSMRSFVAGSDLTYQSQKLDEQQQRRRSWRMTLVLFVSLLCHNFPEGLAVAVSTVGSPPLGWTVATSIMIHNIPEGIAIAVPCMVARPDSPCLAFGLASASGIAEPVGAWLALTFLGTHQNSQEFSAETLPSLDAKTALDESAMSVYYEQMPPKQELPMENILACVAGIMIMVAVVELYPEAWRHATTKPRNTTTFTPDSEGVTSSSGWCNPSYVVHGKPSIFFGSVCGIIVMVATEWYLNE